jgi:hypothetical protein
MNWEPEVADFADAVFDFLVGACLLAVVILGLLA